MIKLNPSGSDVRKALHGAGEWHHSCNDGFLHDHTQLQDLVQRDLPELSPFRSVCPVCFGMDLVIEQLRLRGLVDSFQLLDTTPALEHVINRNIALQAIGFTDPVFDESGFDGKEWGFDFGQASEE